MRGELLFGEEPPKGPSDEDTLRALREFVRSEARIVFREMLEQVRKADDEWLTVKQAAALTTLSVGHIKKLARQLVAAGSPHVYQPFPGKPPLRISRAALRDMHVLQQERRADGK